MKNAMLTLGVLIVLAAGTALEAKDLYWNALDVHATLQSDGSLAVVERHQMVFTGDWNGGERVFDIRRGQTLDVHSIRRVENGNVTELVQGDLATVDNWARMGDAVRWRSRDPNDPPFENEPLTYEISYTLHNPLTARGDRYFLDHEFVMLDRSGRIERFSLRFDAESPWSTDAELPLEATASALEPGDGYQLELTLRRTDGSVMDGVIRQLSYSATGGGILFMFGSVALLFSRWRSYELKRGRMGPLPSISRDEAHRAFAEWKPEVLGAAWDESVGAPEVAAVLARLEAEKRVRSNVVNAEGREELELELQVPRAALEGYERELVDGLFVDGDRTTTAKVREHYRALHRGFDPSALIRTEVMQEVERHASWTGDSSRWGCLLALIPWAAGLVASIVWALLTPAAEDVMVPGALMSGFVVLVGGLIAHSTARKAAATSGVAVAWNILPFVGLGVVSLFILVSGMVTTLWDLGGFVTIACLAYASIAWAARTPLSPERLALRRWLLSLREWTQRELQKPEPDLRDEWMPHILALGLSGDVDRWFGAVRTASPGGAIPVSRISTSGSSGSVSSGPGGAWSGGGTSFGGGGATASWVAAASTMAAGVSSPSSGGSGGGGGGGSSSGGGGGGGW